MRLKQINLAGFKSFVDSTKIPFEQQMTAIVGPNGCGKSNIIDAVRWVLGESSAKNLRGDTMTDVIFNGANSRKPVGQASVELIFDNTQGRLKGSMADRSQVSIRRTVNRDSINTYYLNSAKCRRKDITDIFLGTGLGPRSYAIIEQGTISRLIESKPQDLRIFIEEAAGISKYKERRRETETRIRHTRENLARLADIRSELSLQVDKLHQQAEAAKRFKTLKTSERKYKAELAVFRWQHFSSKNELILQDVGQAQLQIEQLILSDKQNDISLFQLKQKNSLEGESLSDLQNNKLELTQGIAKIEQNIKHAQQENIKLASELAANKQQYQTLLTASKQTIVDQQQVNVQLAQERPKLELVEMDIDSAQKNLSILMDKQQDCQQRWDNFNNTQRDKVQQLSMIEIELSSIKTTIQNTKQRKDEIDSLITENEQVCSSNSPDELNSQLLKENDQLIQLNAQTTDIERQIDQDENTLAQEVKHLAQQQGIKHALQQNLIQLKSTASLPADWLVRQTQWLKEKNITVDGAFHEQIIVEDKWQLACEQVLSVYLTAQVVDVLPTELSLSTVFLIKREVKKDQVNNQVNDPIKVKTDTLAEQVKGNHAFIEVLNQIYLAENLEQAHQLLLSLSQECSVICPDGTWLSHHFLRKGAIEASEQVLQRSSNIKKIAVDIVELERKCQQSQLQESDTRQKLAELKLKKVAMNKQQQIKQLLCQQLSQEKALKEQEHQQQIKQKKLLTSQLVTIEQQLKQQQYLLSQCIEQQARAIEDRSSYQQDEKLIEEREQVQQQMQTCQLQSQALHNDRHHLALKVEQAKHSEKQIGELIIKNADVINRLEQKTSSLHRQIQQNEPQLADNKQTLQMWLTQISSVDDKLITINQEQSNAAEKIKRIDNNKKENLREIDKLKERLNTQNLEAQNYKLRADSALEQLKEQQQNVKDVQANISEQVKEGVWQAHIIRLAKDINRLGAINLAAINEYESQVARKNHLDQQNDDLTTAINTLESAIAKIDKESRQKFQITFDLVNKDLKALFPKVFGGGSAYLELTGDDLLDTGVSIMARPPGKKNSTIHQLSGGEKALTALSLVFAIFRLNPAPFCMLDEVDAPLDDANVERFCNLVREMSQTVQFIYISHNKIAMEMASHLTGVTMFEPGVSRMVAVDIDEAVAMAES